MLEILKDGQDLSRILKRAKLDSGEITMRVRTIVNDVRERGDEALFYYTEKFDKIKLDKNTVEVSAEETEAALKAVPPRALEALKNAKANILEYHKRQRRLDDIKDINGIKTGWLVRPVPRAGIYVPGGKAAYPSSVLMCAVPALVAGVKDIVMVSPAAGGLNPLTVTAAQECGVKRIFKVGGAQAVAALAFGTESIPKADVISGPGNIYVTLAKKEVFGSAAIDMTAGPSEILIIADETANPEFVAADLLSQAEHDELAMSVLITTSEPLAKAVKAELNKQIHELKRYPIASSSIKNYGAAIVVKDIKRAVELSNIIAPEHLELCVKNADELTDKIENAGAVFIGNYSPEPLGDYYAGPNHVLPTSGTARHFSALSVDNYIKKISVIKYNKDALNKAADDIITLAECEGLDAHANTIRVRKDR